MGVTDRPRVARPGGLSGRWGLSRPLAVRALTMAASLAMTVVVARVLDPRAAGGFFVVVAVLQAAATLGRFGTDNMALKLAAGTPSQAAADGPGLLTVCLVACVPATAGFVTVLLLVPVLEGRPPPAVVLLLALAVPAAAVSVLAGAVLRGLGRLVSGIVLELGLPPALCAVVLLVWTGLPRPLDAWQALGVYAGCHLLTAVLALIVAGRGLAAVGTRATRDGGPDSQAPGAQRAGSVFARHRSSLTAMMATSALFYLLTWSPVIVLGLTGNPTQAAYYNVAARMVAFITVVPALQVATLTPPFAAFHRHRRLGDLNDLARRATRLALAVAVPLALVCTVAPTQVLSLFGRDYHGGAAALVISAIGSGLVVAVGPVNPLLLTCGHEHWAGRANGVLLVTSVLLMVPAAGPLGAAGVAGVLTAGTLAYSLAAAHTLRSRESITAGYLLLPRLRLGGHG